MTVLQFCGPMAFRVLQWCHPMLASSSRTSCCTRMITLYGTRKWIQARAIWNKWKYESVNKWLTVINRSRDKREEEEFIAG